MYFLPQHGINLSDPRSIFSLWCDFFIFYHILWNYYSILPLNDWNKGFTKFWILIITLVFRWERKKRSNSHISITIMMSFFFEGNYIMMSLLHNDDFNLILIIVKDLKVSKKIIETPHIEYHCYCINIYSLKFVLFIFSIIDQIKISK